MPEIVHVDNEHGIILIESSDLVVADDLSNSLHRVLEIARDTGFTKVMVVAENLLLLPSFLHIHAFGQELAEKTIGFKHAIVVSEHSPKDLVYLETVARNRGACMQIFTSRTDALKWFNQ